MKKLGLIFNIVGVVILGFFTPMVTGYGSGGLKPTNPDLYMAGWIALFIGFLSSLFGEFKKK